KTIDLDWQILLMDAVREIDEARDAKSTAAARSTSSGRTVLVLDDSLMLLSFVKEILSEANYQVNTAATAEEGIASAASEVPDLVLLDYVLPDMKGDEVCQRLAQNSSTAKVPIIYMSGFGTDLQPDQITSANVIGSLNKPFTSDLLLKTVENYMPKEPSESEPKPMENEPTLPATESWTHPDPEAPSQPTWPEPEPYVSKEPVWPEPEPTAEEPA